MKTKQKTYVLMVAREFPQTHQRKGEATNFVDSIKLQIAFGGNGKKHTIRKNYPLWEKRINEVLEGNAIISLRYWSGKPYKSPQVEFATLDKDSGCGVQLLRFPAISICERKETPLSVLIDKAKSIYNIDLVAENDGLSLEDFKSWFQRYDLIKPMAIIHFTKFRY